MANPLTLYVPIKQDKITQDAAQAAHDHFVRLHSKELDRFEVVHYARFLLIPNADGPGNQAICMITTFDGPMNPYLKSFWNDDALQTLFGGLADMALRPGPPVKDFTAFENFINNNNISKPDQLYQAYDHSVLKIKAKFKPTA